MIAFEQRASTVLFNLICSHPREGVVLLPANICPIVPITLAKAGRACEFVDIDQESLCMDHDAVMARWTDGKHKPAGLLFARTYGAIFDASRTFSAIKAIDSEALVIDDRCLCMPDFTEILPEGVDVALYSTGQSKCVDIGYGGYGIIRDGIPYFRRHCPFDKESLSAITNDYKYSLQQRQAFVYHESDWLVTAEPHVSWATYRQRVEAHQKIVLRQKSEINAIYAEGLPRAIQLPEAFNFWRFNIQVNDKTEVLAAIRRENLFASSHYDSLAGLFGAGVAPIAENLHSHVINLFNDRYFNLDQALVLTKVLAGLEHSNPETLFS